MRSLFGSIAAGLQVKDGAQSLDWLPTFAMLPETKSGVTVNYKTALQVTAVLACCKVIAEGVAQVPWKLQRARVNGQGADDAVDHPLYQLLLQRPNGWQTSFEFREMLTYHTALCTNAFVYKNRVGGRIFELIPLEPARVQVTQLNDYSLVYDVTGLDGRVRRFGQADIWHIRGPSWNGWVGEETIRLAREAIGLASALEAGHATMHKNMVQPTGVYSVEGTLTDEQQKNLTAWIKGHAAGRKLGNPLVLDRNAKWVAQQMSGVDAQHLETRRFQIEEICRAFRVMPIMVGLSEKTATYASSEQMFLAHVTHTLGPWYSRLEQSSAVALLDPKDPADARLFTRFMDDQLMRGDYLTRQQGKEIQRRNGALNADEWRIDEGRNPRGDAGGAEYIIALNMGPNDGKPPAPTLIKTSATPPVEDDQAA